MPSTSSGLQALATSRATALIPTVLALYASSVAQALAHNVTPGDAGYIQEIWGVHIIPFIYLGAKHMVTGYDHILFLLFALGHSTTMLLGVYFNIGINSYLIDAIIGLSIVYKALDNLGAFQSWFGVQPNTKAATLIFGFCHGFGLSSKIIEYNISPDGLVVNLLAFNVGVELGQLTALALILVAMRHWRANPAFARQALRANVIMMGLGFYLMGVQLVGLAFA